MQKNIARTACDCGKALAKAVEIRYNEGDSTKKSRRYLILMELSETIRKMERSAVRLAIGGPAEEKAGASRFGGRPDVPEGFAWPSWPGEDGGTHPLSFLAQFDCAALAPLDREGLLPKTGLLSFFYDAESQPWGFDPADRGCARVFWFEDAALSPAPFPENLEEESRFPTLGVSMREERSFPGWEDFCAAQPGGQDDADSFYEERALLGAEDAENRSQLLGWPDVIQNSMPLECELVSRGHYLGGLWEDVSEEERLEAKTRAVGEWRLLFQLDTVEAPGFELMFGDCGRIYFYIRKEDLKARRFDRVWLILQCC